MMFLFYKLIFCWRFDLLRLELKSPKIESHWTEIDRLNRNIAHFPHIIGNVLFGAGGGNDFLTLNYHLLAADKHDPYLFAPRPCPPFLVPLYTICIFGSPHQTPPSVSPLSPGSSFTYFSVSPILLFVCPEIETLLVPFFHLPFQVFPATLSHPVSDPGSPFLPSPLSQHQFHVRLPSI